MKRCAPCFTRDCIHAARRISHFTDGTGAKYSNRSVSVCVCLLKRRLSASSFANLKNRIHKVTPNFLYGFSAPPGRQCNTLCISGFVEDVVVSENRPSRRMHSFYRAMLCIRGTSHGPVSVRPSVRPSQVGVLLKRLNVGSHKQHHTIPQGL